MGRTRYMCVAGAEDQARFHYVMLGNRQRMLAFNRSLPQLYLWPIDRLSDDQHIPVS